MLTLDQLRVLDAIARTGSFAAAGKELRRATSAISYGVQKLEEALDLVLFDRAGHRAELTEAGEAVLAEGRRLLDRADRLEGLARSLRDEWEPRLSLVVDGALPAEPVMRACRALVSRGLPTRLSVHVEYLGGVLERFEREPADLAVALDFSGDAERAAHPLGPVDLVLLAAPSHPLCDGAPVDRARLAEHVELMVEDSGREGRARAGRLALGSPQVFWLGDFHTKRQALRMGVGYGWMPTHLVHDDLARGCLATVPYEEGHAHHFVPHLVYRRGVPRGRAGQLLSDLLFAELS